MVKTGRGNEETLIHTEYRPFLFKPVTRCRTVRCLKYEYCIKNKNWGMLYFKSIQEYTLIHTSWVYKSIPWYILQEYTRVYLDTYFRSIQEYTLKHTSGVYKSRPWYLLQEYTRVYIDKYFRSIQEYTLIHTSGVYKSRPWYLLQEYTREYNRNWFILQRYKSCSQEDGTIYSLAKKKYFKPFLHYVHHVKLVGTWFVFEQYLTDSINSKAEILLI